MNHDEIISMAREAGIDAYPDHLRSYESESVNISVVERFFHAAYAAGAAAERERWAPDVDELAQHIRWLNGGNKKMGAGALAEKLVDWLRSRV